MAEVRDQRQRERAKARAGRRPSVDDVVEQSDEPGAGVDLKRAAATALSAALVGALVGAAKSVADKRGQTDTRGQSDEAESDDADGDPAETRPEPEDEGVSDGHDDDDEPQDEPEQDEPPQDDPPQQQTGASSDDVASIIARAKEHVEAVIGSEAESVSGVERTNGSWRVNVEVVQMRRIPESTDVLASYGVVLDGDGDLISVQEMRRYRRSQAGDDR